MVFDPRELREILPQVGKMARDVTDPDWTLREGLYAVSRPVDQEARLVPAFGIAALTQSANLQLLSTAPGVRGLIINPASDVTVQSTYDGTVYSGLPADRRPTVLLNGVDVSGDAAVTYTVDYNAAELGVSVAAGVATISSISAASSTVTWTVFYNGVEQGQTAILVQRQADSSPPSSSTSGVTSQPQEALTQITNEFAAAGGTTVKGSAPLSYTAGGTSGQTAVVYGVWRYKGADAIWHDFGAELMGSTATAANRYYQSGEWMVEPGSSGYGNFTQQVTLPAGSQTVALFARKTGAPVNLNGSATFETL